MGNYNTDTNGVQTLSVAATGDAGLVIDTNFSTLSGLVTGLNTSKATVTALNSLTATVATNTTAIAACLPLAGGTMSGAINLGGTNLNNVGKIGIGTATPSNLIDVQSNASNYISNKCTLSTGVAAFRAINDTANVMEFGKFGSTTTANGVVAAGDGYFYSDNNALSFGAIGSLMKFGLGASLTEAMRLNTTGLGIGCTPAQKLDVQGTSIFRNAGATAATTINGSIITVSGTATNIPVTLNEKGSGGLIFADINNNLAATLGAGAIDLQGSSGSQKSGTAAGTGSALLGGNGTNSIAATATGGVIIGGQSNTISGGFNNVVLGASSNTQTLPTNTVATGNAPAPRTNYGLYQSANDAWTFPFSPAQTACIPLVATTIDGTTFVTMKAGGTSYFANDNAITILSNMTMAYSAIIVGRCFTTNNLTAAFELKGLIDNNGTTTALIGSFVKTTIGDETAGVFTCQPALSGNTLAIQVKGSAAQTVRWSARVQLVEVSGFTTGGVS
jgi:hypothetical protein